MMKSQGPLAQQLPASRSGKLAKSRASSRMAKAKSLLGMFKGSSK